MFFRTALAVAATAASMAYAQGVTFSDVTLNQCAPATVGFTAPAGSYYVAIVPANDACSGAPFAEFHDVSSGTVDVAAVAIASGTQVQAYVTGADGNEYWSGVLTVGDGDSACLNAASSSSSPSVAEATPSSSSASTSPSAYVVPANNVASTPYRAATTPSSSNSDDNTFDDTPANAAANGASSVTASLTLIGGALFAAAALL